MIMNSKKIVTMVFMFTFAFVIISPSTFQFSFARLNTDSSSDSSTKDKTKSNTETSDKSNSNSGDTNNDKKQFERFGKCLTMISDNKEFATEKEIKACVMVIYDSDSSISNTSSSLMSKDNTIK